MNAITTQGMNSLQGALPAAIKKANDKDAVLSTKPLVLVNIRRKIYDTFMEFGGPLLTSELCNHLQSFGYYEASVATAMHLMYKDGLLERTKLAPYAYTLKENCPVPNDKVFVYRTAPKSKAQKDAEIKAMKKAEKAKLNELPKAIVTIGKAAPLEPMSSLQYPAIPTFSQDVLKITSGKNIEAEYLGLSRDIDTIRKYLCTLEEHVAKVRDIAELIRKMKI